MQQLTPTPTSASTSKKKHPTVTPVQLILDFPEASRQALETFSQITQNAYQNKSLGITKQLEDAMVCDCSWAPGQPPEYACSEHSGCINYLTQIECLQDQCRCGEHCQNQRFQKQQYAPIEIVLTSNKGFGMRTQSNLPKDTFIYEYVGEVIGLKTFQKKMRDYAEEGLKHFYFMELQRDQYIDATKKGGLGRFINHSCSPNCYIAKWVVGRQLRMGIFTKRSVVAGEELTFNYNVDRYGHEAQQCFCGEPNCVGYLGGKTQTDLGAMDELYIDALGIVDDVETMNLKGTKHKKSKRMDIDYMPVMKPIPLKDVPRVSSAIRQSISNKRILTKLLRRIMITTDQAVQKQLMRLHGFSIMSMVLNEYLTDHEIVKTTLEILLKWPLITKNKILSTNIEETVIKLSANPSEVIQTLAAELINMWVALEVSYRIPKDTKGKEGADASKRKAEVLLDQIFSKRLRDSNTRKDSNTGLKLVSEKVFIRPEAAKRIDPSTIQPESIQLPTDWKFERTAEGKPYYYHIHLRQTQWTVPTAQDVARVDKLIAEDFQRQKAAAFDVEDIVAKVKSQADQIRRQSFATADLPQPLDFSQDDPAYLTSLAGGDLTSSHGSSSAKARSQHPRSKKPKDHHQKILLGSSSSSSADPSKAQMIKNKKMLKLFSNVVVHTMSRYKHALDHDQFKKRARELTNILCDKEKKSRDYESQTYERISTSKEAKIKAFTKDWVSKLLRRKGVPIEGSSRDVARRGEEEDGRRMSKPESASPEADDSTPMARGMPSTMGSPADDRSPSISSMRSLQLDDQQDG